MVEMSPAEGGHLNIPTGVHSYDMYADITLKATPKPGYQFVCWLGSVSNSVTDSTTVFLNSPKMIIAVFERTEFSTPGDEATGGYTMAGGSDSGGGVVRSEGLSDSSVEEAEVKIKQTSPYYYKPSTTPEPPPVPTPEPATVTLFFTGFLMLVNRRKNGVNLIDKI